MTDLEQDIREIAAALDQYTDTVRRMHEAHSRAVAELWSEIADIHDAVLTTRNLIGASSRDAA